MGGHPFNNFFLMYISTLCFNLLFLKFWGLFFLERRDANGGLGKMLSGG